jgi:hypothetical protein
LVEGGRFGAEAKVNGLALGFVGPFPVGSVASARITVTGAMRLAALHSPLKHGSLAEETQFGEFLP